MKTRKPLSSKILALEVIKNYMCNLKLIRQLQLVHTLSKGKVTTWQNNIHNKNEHNFSLNYLRTVIYIIWFEINELV